MCHGAMFGRLLLVAGRSGPRALDSLRIGQISLYNFKNTLVTPSRYFFWAPCAQAASISPPTLVSLNPTMQNKTLREYTTTARDRSLKHSGSYSSDESDNEYDKGREVDEESDDEDDVDDAAQRHDEVFEAHQNYQKQLFSPDESDDTAVISDSEMETRVKEMLQSGGSLSKSGEQDDGLPFWTNIKRLLRGNEVEEALRLLKEHVENNPHDYQMCIRLADLYMALSDLKSVVMCTTYSLDNLSKVADNAIIAPDSLQDQDEDWAIESTAEDYRIACYSLRGEAFDRLGMRDRALADYHEVLSKRPDKGDILQRLAFLQLQRHETPGRPTVPEGNEASGLERGGGEQLQKAPLPSLDEIANLFSSCIEMDERDPEPHFGLGMVRMRQDKYKEAAESFGRAGEVSAEYAPAWVKKGTCHQLLKEFTEASQAYTTFLERAESYYVKFKEDVTFDVSTLIGQTFLNRAICLIQQGELTAAEEDLKVVKSLHDESGEGVPANGALLPQMYNLQATIYLKKSDYAECVDTATKTIELDPKNFTAFAIRRQAYIHLEENNLAFEDDRVLRKLADDIQAASTASSSSQ